MAALFVETGSGSHAFLHSHFAEPMLASFWRGAQARGWATRLNLAEHVLPGGARELSDSQGTHTYPGLQRVPWPWKHLAGAGS